MTSSILITGCSGKLGSALSDFFLKKGHQVIAICREGEPSKMLRSTFAKYGDKFIIIESDLLTKNSSKNIIKELDNLCIRPNYLINNARNIEFLRLENNGLVSRDNFQNEFLLDVIVPYELTMSLANQKEGCLKGVINMGSMYGTVAVNPSLYKDPKKGLPPHYGVAKAALAHLTKELAIRLAPNGIQVNCIAFGGVHGRVDEEFMQRYSLLCPQSRMLTIEDVIGPVASIISGSFSSMTGHTMVVDGGWSIW